MPCVGGKDTYPDLQTALRVRDSLIDRYAVPMLAYKCVGGCSKWHITTQWKSGRRVKKWNGIDTLPGWRNYRKRVTDAGFQPPIIETIKVEGEILLCGAEQDARSMTPMGTNVIRPCA